MPRLPTNCATQPDYRTFSTLRIRSGEVEATYQGKFPVSGKLTETGGGEMVFAYTVTLLNLSYVNRMSLEPFGTGGYLASRLASWIVTGGKTNLTWDYTLLSAGTNPLHTSLSPFTLYSSAQIMELSEGKLYTIHGDTRQQIQKPLAKTQFKTRAQAKFRRGIVLLVLTAFGVSAFWLVFARRRSLGQPDVRKR